MGALFAVSFVVYEKRHVRKSVAVYTISLASTSAMAVAWDRCARRKKRSELRRR